jgi:hypothetical protein
MRKNRVFDEVDEKEYPAYRRRVLAAVKGLSGLIRIEYEQANGSLKKEKNLIYLGKSCQL